jgi:hypothetical protein
VGGRKGVGGWWDMDSKNRKKRVYGEGGRIGEGGWCTILFPWETRQRTQIEERVLDRRENRSGRMVGN